MCSSGSEMEIKSKHTVLQPKIEIHTSVSISRKRPNDSGGILWRDALISMGSLCYLALRDLSSY